MSDERLSYRFGPLEHRGLLGPLRRGQAVVIGATLAAVVTIIDTVGGGVALVLVVAAVALAVVCTTVPLNGRTLEQWAPLLCAFLLRGERRFHSRLPTSGVAHLTVGGAAPDGSGRGGADAAELPPPLRDVKLITVQGDRRHPGALSARHGRELTFVLACRALSFALLDPEAQERRLAQWGSVLSSAASTPIKRLQWIERTAPAQGDELARWLHSARDPALPARGVPIVESYLELISQSTQVRHDHEILLAAQIDTARVRQRRDLVGELAMEHVAQLAHSLAAAEVEVLGILSAPRIARVLRTAFDPYARAELGAMDARATTFGAGAAERDGREPREGHDRKLAQHMAAPLATRERWDHYRCDGALHATFWISGWPRTGVSPMFMDALLGTSATVRTVAVTFEPLSPERSAREVEAAITRDRADSEIRRRFGQSETARQRQAQEAAARREAELAAGHCEVRLAGFVTVSGRDERELRHACSEIHTQAARGRLELRRMYGQQAEAFSFTLPLARGLR